MTFVAFLDDETDEETGASMSSAKRLFPGAHGTFRRFARGAAESVSTFGICQMLNKGLTDQL